MTTISSQALRVVHTPRTTHTGTGRFDYRCTPHHPRFPSVSRPPPLFCFSITINRLEQVIVSSQCVGPLRVLRVPYSHTLDLSPDQGCDSSSPCPLCVHLFEIPALFPCSQVHTHVHPSCSLPRCFRCPLPGPSRGLVDCTPLSVNLSIRHP